MRKVLVLETAPLQKRLKPGTVPSVFPWTKAPSECQLNRAERAKKRMRTEEPEVEGIVELDEYLGAQETVEEESGEIFMFIGPDSPKEPEPKSRDGIAQTKESGRTRLRSTDHQFDPKTFNFFTGLEDYGLFNLIFHHFGPVVNELNYYYGTTPP